MLYSKAFEKFHIFHTGCVYDGFKIIKMNKIQFIIPENRQLGAGFMIYHRNKTAPLLHRVYLSVIRLTTSN